MIKVKDGYAKLIGTTYQGSAIQVLLSNGGNLEFSSATKANTLVQRNASQHIYATYFNSAISDEALTDIGSVYVRNTSDTFIRRISKTQFYSIIDNKFVTLDTAQTITGVKTFSTGPILANNAIITQNQNSTSNYTTVVKWLKGGTSQGTYNPSIGQHNTGGDGTGSICILPYPTETRPWDGTVGLFVSKGVLKLDGQDVIHSGNYTSYVLKIGTATVGATNKGIYLNAGTPTAMSASAGSSALPVYMASGAIVACTASSVFSALANSGNNLSITVAGQNRQLVVNYSTYASYLSSWDNRSVNNTPSTYGSSARFEFKANSADGLSNGGSYHGILHFKPYGGTTDFTGGQTHQLGFTDSGNLYMRTSTNSTTWGAWKLLMNEPNANSKYVTALGTSGNYVTWTKNGTTNNLTVPYSVNSDKLDGYHETSFFRARGSQAIASYTPTTTELSSNNNLSGSWTVSYPGASGHLVQFNTGGGSTRYMQFYSHYSGSLCWRNSTDSTLSSKPWKTIVDSANYTGIILKIGTATKGSATLPIYLNAGTPTACSTTLGVSITGNADTVDGVHVKWAGRLTSTSHLVAWEADGSALRDINPADITVGNSGQLGGKSTGYYVPRNAGRDWTNGCLVITDLKASSSVPWLIIIEGNSYGAGSPFMIQCQGYDYSGSSNHINYGGWQVNGLKSGVHAFRYNGLLCFWFKQDSYWQGFSVRVYKCDETYNYNHVTSVSNSALPARDREVIISPAPLAYISSTVDSATKLKTARNINGTLFNGTSDITTARWGYARTLTLTGSITGSATIDGSGNVSMATTYQAGNIGNLDARYVNVTGDTMTGSLKLKTKSLTRNIVYSDSGTDNMIFGDVNGSTVIRGSNISFQNSVGSGIFQINGNIGKFTNTPLVGTNKIWHAGNDGSGSGLDADMVDGLHSSSILQTSNLGSGSGKSFNFNDYNATKYYYTDGDINSPALYNSPFSSSVGGFGVMMFKYSSYGTQLAFEYNGDIYSRNRLYRGGVVWNSWNKLLNSANYKEVLDTNYVKKSGDTMTGNLTAPNFIKTGSNNNYVLLGGGNHKAISQFIYSDYGSCGVNERTGNSDDLGRAGFWRDNNLGSYGVTLMHSDSANYQCKIYHDYGNGGNLYMKTRSNGTWGTAYTIWNSGNLNPGNYVTALGTSGNYLTWTKNGTTNNLTVPYATNADKLDGYHANTSQNPFGKIPTIGSDGVMEVGRYLDFHYNSSDTSDYRTRLYINHSSGSYTAILPAKSGTLAMTSDIPTVTNYYWANVRVSSSSSTGTSPTFSTAYTSNWFRSTGNTGWYSETYGGGWNMTDTTYIRAYGSKRVYNANTSQYAFYTSGGMTAAKGFWHSAVNSNSYVLLAGGSYKAVSDFATKSHTHSYLPLSGGTMTGSITFPNNAGIIQNQNSGSNYTKAISWNVSGATKAQIGSHNTGGDGTGSITILPYTTTTDAWSGSVGLFVYKGGAKIDGAQVLTSGNYTGTLDGRYVTLATNQTVSGVKTFSKQQKFTVAGGTSPFTVSSPTVVANLNSDLLDGYHASSFAKGNAGASNRGVYVAGGKVTAMTYYLNTTVNSGTSGKLAYYSGTTTLTSYTNTVGSPAQPIYLNAGSPSVSSYSFTGTSSNPVIVWCGEIYRSAPSSTSWYSTKKGGCCDISFTTNNTGSNGNLVISIPNCEPYAAFCSTIRIFNGSTPVSAGDGIQDGRSAGMGDYMTLCNVSGTTGSVYIKKFGLRDKNNDGWTNGDLKRTKTSDGNRPVARFYLMIVGIYI